MCKKVKNQKKKKNEKYIAMIKKLLHQNRDLKMEFQLITFCIMR